MRVVSISPEQTMAAGRVLASRLERGTTVCLYGELGAGKTVFVKGMASALGIPERDIISASFTIVAEHEVQGGKMPLYHIDLYRLHGSEDAEAAGVYEYIGADGITVIEWAERLGPLEVANDIINVHMDIVSADERTIDIEEPDEKNRHNL